MLAAGITRKSERRLVDKPGGIVVILNLDAVIGVIADTSGSIQCVLSQRILIAQDRNATIRTP